MGSYVGLDVADKQTAICVIDYAGEKRWEGKVRTAPELIAATRERAPDAVRIGLKTGPLCVWLWHALNEAGLPIVSLHARQTSAALALQANKTDRNDAGRPGAHCPVRLVQGRGGQVARCSQAAGATCDTRPARRHEHQSGEQDP